MTTSGDVMLMLYATAGIMFSVWALLVAVALVFSRKAGHARMCMERAPGLALIVGGALGVPMIIAAFVFIALPNPALKLIGAGLFAVMLSISAVGGGGLAMLVGDRIERMEPGRSGFSALARGAGLLVAAGIVPLLGWFAYLPIVTFACFGAGLQGLMVRPMPDAVIAPNEILR